MQRSIVVVICSLVASFGLGAAARSAAAPGHEPVRPTVVTAHRAVSPVPTTVGPAWAPAQVHEYVGSRDGCRKCHLREYRSWEKTPHADAFELLSPQEQADPGCIRCHSTGFGEPGGFASLADTPQLAGIGCEACHGPGSAYRDKETMKDHDASIAAGMLVPDEATCLACHNAESPTFAGEFDYLARREAGVHAAKRER